jgi:thiamine-monophosphate kinase
MTRIALGAGGEFDRVRAIAAALGDAIGPIGDDTAPIPEGEGTLVVSVDASVEDVHFRRGWLSHEEIGWRATAGALSDLAAAAATPVGVVAAVVVPRKAGEEALVDLMRGVGAAATSTGARVIGGDLTSGEQWAVVVTVFGRAVRPMSRVGATPGDGVWVTGVIGGARAALQAWTTSIEPDPEARRVFAHPIPRIGAARWLAARGATALIDLSDGLGGDAEHLAMASGVQLRIELERLPLHGSVASAARHIDEPPELFAATAGEDYELLVTLPGGFDGAAEFLRVHGIALTRVGTVGPGIGVHATLLGKERPVHGFRHAV